MKIKYYYIIIPFIIIFITLIFFEVFLRITKPGLTDIWKIMQYDKHIIRRPKPNIKNASINGLSGEFCYIANTDINGFRLSTSELKTKLKKILILGDSMTFGHGINDDETYPAYLNKFQSKYTFINGGFHGCSPDSYYTYLLQNREKLHYPQFSIV